MDSITYKIADSLYLNITNRCTNQCGFCIRYKNRQFNRQHPLWLDREPTTEEILKAIGDPSQYAEMVFCGYGEPLIRLETVIEVAKKLKHERTEEQRNKKTKPRIRLDTNGQANLFWGRNVLPELKGLIDSISVSLNAPDAETYNAICYSRFGKKAYPAVIEFIQEAKKYIPEVVATIVDLPNIDKDACRRIAAELGAAFRVRPYYEKSYRA